MKILLFCLSFIISFGLSACTPNPNTRPVAIETVAEIEEIYIENEASFQEVAEQLHSYGTSNEQFLYVYSNVSERGEFNVATWFYTLGTYFVESSSPIDDIQLQDIQNSIGLLFDKVDMEVIISKDNYCCFLLDYGAGNTAVLYYVVNGERPPSVPGITGELQIDSNWYARTTFS